MKYLQYIVPQLTKKCIGSILMCVFVLTLHAQTYDIPDANFRDKLAENYPEFIIDGLLDISAAANHYGELTLNDAEITSLAGIEYFVNLNTLNAVNNNLTSVDEISGLNRLVNLYLTNNQIAQLPPLNNLVELYDFQITGNDLSQLPDMSNLTNLTYFYCGDNNFTSPPNLSQLNALEILVMSGNNINESPDLSNFTLLKELHLDRTGISEITQLDALVNLRKLYAWGNNITQLNGLENNTTLEVLVVSDNKLQTLPTIDNKPNLTTLVLSNNLFTFEGLLSIIDHPNFENFIYIPQANISINSGSARETTSFVFTVNIDQTNNNSYLWHKDDVLIETTQNNSYTLQKIRKSDEGNYSVHVVNDLLPDLIIISDVATLAVLDCIDFNGFNVTETYTSCEKGSDLSVYYDLNGGTHPFYYQLKNNGFELKNNTGVFNDVPAGIYKVLLIDDKGCEVEEQMVVIEQKNDCQAIFSPDGDGVMDTYFINEPGRIQIVDKSRNVIKTLQGPAVWDGTTDQGAMANAGYYAIVINETKVINITLVR